MARTVERGRLALAIDGRTIGRVARTVGRYDMCLSVVGCTSGRVVWAVGGAGLTGLESRSVHNWVMYSV